MLFANGQLDLPVNGNALGAVLVEIGANELKCMYYIYGQRCASTSTSFRLNVHQSVLCGGGITEGKQIITDSSSDAH